MFAGISGDESPPEDRVRAKTVPEGAKFAKQPFKILLIYGENTAIIYMGN